MCTWTVSTTESNTTTPSVPRDLAGSGAGGVRRRLDAAGEVVEHADVAAAVRRGDYALHSAVRRRLSAGGRAPRLAELRADDQSAHRGDDRIPTTSWTKNWGTAASMSYVTGSHAFKTGMTFGWGKNYTTRSANGQIQQLNFNQRQPDLGRRSQHAVHGDAESEGGFRDLRAGHLDDEAAHAELRRPLRPLQLPGAGAVLRIRLPGCRSSATSRRLRTCRTGTTGRSGSPAPTTCSGRGRPH